MSRLLIIEDDPWLADSYKTLLKEYDPMIVNRGDKAVESIDELSFDLILADVMLEGGTVIDLLHELQSYNDTRDIPVVLCTQLALTLSVKDLEAYGVVRILDKATVTPKKLKNTVHEVISNTYHA